MLNKLKVWAKNIKYHLYALYLVYHHQNVPLIAKIVAVIVVSYALSSIDLIPDFIPIIGYIDDLILLPLGIMLAIKLIPIEVWTECKIKAQEYTLKSLPRSKMAAIVVIFIWIMIVFLIYLAVN